MSLLRNLLWGLAWGATLAAIYSVIALCIYAVAGQHAIRSPELNIGKILATYRVGGLGGGVPLGLGRPLLHYRPGRVVLCILIGVLVFGAVQTAVEGPDWFGYGREWFIPLLLGGAFGTGAAFDPRFGG